MEKIHIAMMFNDNYSIPGGVAILSLLQNSSRDYKYMLYILHNDINSQHQEKLHAIVNQFDNAELNFINMNNYLEKFSDHLSYPKEVLYKLCIPSIFPQLDKIIITDVDVVFADDVSKEYIAFDSDEYFAGVKQAQDPTHPPFSMDIKDDNYHFIVGAGYMIYNLKRMRADDMESKFLAYLEENVDYARLPDQDVLCQLCYPEIKLLHPRNMVLINWYVTDNYLFEFPYAATAKELSEALENPVQIHYTPSLDPQWINRWKKPWLDPFCPKAEIWYYYLSQTPFFQENFRKNLGICEEQIRRKKKKTLKQRLQKIAKKIKKFFFRQ